MTNAENSRHLLEGIHMKRVENLFLDPENPRLAKSGEITDDSQLLKEIYRRYDLGDVLLSLAQHGYFSEEPLIAAPRKESSPSGSETFTIVEGNRRLAALKLLLFKDARELVGVKKLPDLADGVQQQLNPVPVKIYASRKEIVTYLGVRHITGVKPWDTYSKAKYTQKLAEEGMSIKEVTTMVSSRSDVVCRSLLTLYVINQANEISDQAWEEDVKSFKFSFLYTALGYVSIRNHLGLSPTALESPQPNLIPENRRKELIRTMNYLYGTPDQTKGPKLSDSRDIKKLAAVYESQDGLDALKGGASLDQAYRKSGGEQAQLVDLLQEAGVRLDEANAIAPHHKRDAEASRWAKRCSEAAQHLVNTLEG